MPERKSAEGDSLKRKVLIGLLLAVFLVIALIWSLGVTFQKLLDKLL